MILPMCHTTSHFSHIYQWQTHCGRICSIKNVCGGKRMGPILVESDFVPGLFWNSMARLLLRNLANLKVYQYLVNPTRMGLLVQCIYYCGKSCTLGLDLRLKMRVCMLDRARVGFNGACGKSCSLDPFENTALDADVHAWPSACRARQRRRASSLDWAPS